MAKAAILAGHLAADKGKSAGGKRDPTGVIEGKPGLDQRGDHQPVPIGEDLVVEPGADSRRARLQQQLAAPRQLGLGVCIGKVGRLEPVQDIVAFPVALGGDVVKALEQRGAVTEHGVDLGLGPDVEFAFHVLAVGIEARIEAALRMGHLAVEPSDCFGDALRIKRLARFLPDQRQEACQLGIVVEHLFEMRREPARIGRIARKAAAEMVVDAALRDRRQCARHSLAIRLAAGALPAAPQQFEDAALREFRRMPDAAVQRVDLTQQALGDAVE